MQLNTAVPTVVSRVEAVPFVPTEVVDAVRWKKKNVLSCLRDRRSLREIGGLNAYLTQVRWSVWWALRG